MGAACGSKAQPQPPSQLQNKSSLNEPMLPKPATQKQSETENTARQDKEQEGATSKTATSPAPTANKPTESTAANEAQAEDISKKDKLATPTSENKPLDSKTLIEGSRKRYKSENSKRCWISYCSENAQMALFAERLVAILDEGLSMFEYRYAAKDFIPSKEFTLQRQLELELSDTYCAIVLFDDKTAECKQCQSEIEVLVKYVRRIVPLQMHDEAQFKVDEASPLYHVLSRGYPGTIQRYTIAQQELGLEDISSKVMHNLMIRRKIG